MHDPWGVSKGAPVANELCCLNTTTKKNKTTGLSFDDDDPLFSPHSGISKHELLLTILSLSLEPLRGHTRTHARTFPNVILLFEKYRGCRQNKKKRN